MMVDDDAAHGTEQEPRRRLAEAENPQGPSRSCDLVGEPIERDLASELAYRSDQIAGPEKRVVFVP